MAKIILLVGLLLVTLAAAFPNRKYTYITDSKTIKTDCDECKGKVAGTCECPTNEVDLKCNALGQCACDITQNSCDAYCDCDPDCGKEITAVWKNDLKNFGSKNYIGTTTKVKSKCIDSKYIFDTNPRLGLVISNLHGKTCVELDASSSSDCTNQDYYNFIKRTPEIDMQLDKISKEKATMADTLHGNKSVVNQITAKKRSVKTLSYGVGDEMLSRQQSTSGDHYHSFLLPQRDILGNCDNHKAPGFLNNVAGQSCIQNNTELRTTTPYLGSWQPGKGQDFLNGSFSSTNAKVELGNCFKQDESTWKVTQELNARTCGGNVKEVFYRVYYTPETRIAGKSKNSSGRYVIQKVFADFVIGAGNEQKFGIEFIPFTNKITVQNNKPIGSKVVQRSGNPGYELNSQLIVGLTKTEGVSQQVKVGGFNAYAATKKGMCQTVPGTESNGAENVHLKFGSGAVVSCKAAITDLNQFKTYCETTDIGKLKVINQFTEDFNYLGIWGNVDVNNGDDFVKVIKPIGIADASDKLASPFKAGVYDAVNKTCKINASVEVEILTSKMGATASPQAYIIGAQVSPVAETWVYREGQKNNFYHTASITYKNTLPIKLSGNAYSMLDKMASDLFYPFTLKTKAIALQAASLALLMALMA